LIVNNSEVRLNYVCIYGACGLNFRSGSRVDPRFAKGGDELWRAVSMSLLGGFGEEPPAVHPRGAEPLVGNQVVPIEAERHLSIFRQKRGQRLSL